MLHHHLTEAFDRPGLEELLRTRLDLRLDRVSDPDLSYGLQVFKVVELAERAGWISELLRAAVEARPQHAGLRDLAQAMGLTPSLEMAAVAAVGQPVTEAPSAVKGGRRRLASAAAMPANSWPALDQAVRRICRVEFRGEFRGHGFLVGPDVVLTPSSVVTEFVEGQSTPCDVTCRFDYRVLPTGEIDSGRSVGLHQENGLVDSYGDPLDYALLRLELPMGEERMPPHASEGPRRGWIALPSRSPVVRAKSRDADGGATRRRAPTLYLPHSTANGNFLLSKGLLIDDPETPTDRIRYGIKTHAGSAGAPCLDRSMRLVAMHQSKVRPTTAGGASVGEGVLANAIRKRIVGRRHKANLGRPLPVSMTTGEPEAKPTAPPKPGPVVDTEDPQKGRWGGRAERDGRMLSVRLLKMSGSDFQFDIVVEAIDDTPLLGPVYFHLHDTFSPSRYAIHGISENRAVLDEVSAYGVFTIGAQVRTASHAWTSLELDLADLPDLPKRFKER
jgi:hypothetical protein